LAGDLDAVDSLGDPTDISPGLLAGAAVARIR
jgi:hypothetical protein